MKKLVSIILAGVAIVALNGCGSSGNDYDDGLTTLFLVDDQGFAYADIPYRCDSMNNWSATRFNGEFSFYPGEDCEFDFYGYFGTDPNDYTVPYNEFMYIVDYADEGKNNIPYECSNFNVGNINYTYDDGIYDGSFDYDADDSCVFYL